MYGREALRADGSGAREAPPTDRRTTLVSLTAAMGRAATATLRGGRGSMAAELFGDLPAAAARLEAFRGGLKAVIEGLWAMG